MKRFDLINESDSESLNRNRGKVKKRNVNSILTIEDFNLKPLYFLNTHLSLFAHPFLN